jgi:hypothetical protein
MSRYHNWPEWLGVFAPEAQADFVGAYNPDTGLGVVRTFSRSEARGIKVFAFGPSFGGRGNYTDNDSVYFEVWGGPNLTFRDDRTIPPGGSVGWAETWYPVAHIGGLGYANANTALFLSAQGATLNLGVATSSTRNGSVVLLLNGSEIFRATARIAPDVPFVRSVALPPGMPSQGRATLRLIADSGETIAQYEAIIP